MAKSKRKFDAAASITDELIRIIDRGVLPWRKPWTVGGSSVPLRQTGEPYQGINNFLLTMRTLVAGYTSPYWMTLRQANAMEAKVIMGSKSSVVVYYGTTERDRNADPPPPEWSSAMFRKTEETDGQQAPEARRDCHEVTAG